MIHRFCFILLLVTSIASIAQEITGKITDVSTGEPLALANIRLLRSGLAATSDENGLFKIRFTADGQDTLIISFIGYSTLKVPLNPQQQQNQLSFALQSISLEMPEVQVSASRYAEDIKNIAFDPTPRLIRNSDLNDAPVLSIQDLSQVLQVQPGLTTANEASPQVSLLGGGTDQNLVLLDGAVLYYPFHNLGLVTSIPLGIVDQVYVSLGGFSAQYGDRLSGVINIHTKQPEDRFRTNINFYLFGIETATALKLNKSNSLLLAVRRNFHYLNHFYEYDPTSFQFYDLYGKYIYTPHKNHSLSFVAFQNTDNENGNGRQKSTGLLRSATDNDVAHYTYIRNQQAVHGNKLFSFAWNAQFKPQLTSNLQIYQSAGSTDFGVKLQAEFPDHLDAKFNAPKEQIENDIAIINKSSGASVINKFRDTTVKLDLNYQKSKQLQISAGIAASSYLADYGWGRAYDIDKYINMYFDYAPQDTFSYKKQFSSTSCYYDLVWNISDKLQMRQGNRFSYWSFAASAIPEPRFNLVWKPQTSHTFKLGAGRYSQGIATALERGLIQFLPLYLPADQNDSAETAEHIIASYEHNFSSNSDISLTGYYKRFHNLLKAVDSTGYFSGIPGRSFGFELKAGLRNAFMNSWICYDHSYSQRKFAGEYYDCNYDKRNIIKALSTFKKNRYSLTLYWEFSTGQPYDADLANVYFNSYNYYYSSFRKGYDFFYGTGAYQQLVPMGKIRYPYYHRLDVNIQTHFRLWGATYKPYISVRNVYARKNVLYYDYGFLESLVDEETGEVVKRWIERKAYSLPVLPTVGVNVEF
jgi:ferric enterobactin receptor